MLMFDKRRPFATVHGNTCGVAYKQNGEYFNNAMQHVTEEGVLIDPPPMMAVEDLTSDDDIVAGMKPVPVGTEPVGQDNPRQPVLDDEPPGVVDLAMWGRGHAQYLWADVQKEVLNRFHRRVETRADAIETLVKGNVIHLDEAMKV